MFFSIIIPIYNASVYLDRCVRSILSQSFIDYEIILVNDGSTDGSAELCEMLKAKDTRIKVFHVENGGASRARNIGLGHATGEWVWFVDADDEIKKESLKELHKLSVKYFNCTCILFGLTKIRNDEVVLEYKGEYIEDTLSKDESLKLMYKPQYFDYFGYISVKIFKRSIIVDNRLTYDERMHFGEDRFFLYSFLINHDAVSILVAKSYYNYYLNNDSVMQQLEEEYNPKFISDLYGLLEMKKGIQKRSNKELNELSRVAIIRSVLWNRAILKKFSVKDKARWTFLRKIVVKHLQLSDIFHKENRQMALRCYKFLLLG